MSFFNSNLVDYTIFAFTPGKQVTFLSLVFILKSGQKIIGLQLLRIVYNYCKNLVFYMNIKSIIL